MEREKVGAMVILLFSIAYGYLATKIPLTFLSQQETFTARTMPYALSAAGIVFSILIIVLPTTDPSGRKTLGEETKGMDWKTSVQLIILMLLFGLVMKWLGFILSSILFLMEGFWL